VSESADALECDHCGCDAIDADEEGLFYDGDGGACATCGFPGRVSADGDSEDPHAWWNTSQEPGDRCNRADCEECQAPAESTEEKL